MTTSPVQCITCERFALRAAPLGVHGFGLCALAPKHTSMSAAIVHECAEHRPAEAAVVAARQKALASKGITVTIAPHAAR